LTPVHLYQARHPYLPLLACGLHLGLDPDCDSFLAAGLRHDWQAAPLLVAGADKSGTVVGCLVHGCQPDLYARTMDGLGGLFGITLSRLDLDAAVRTLTMADRLQAGMAVWLPAYGQSHRSAVALLIRPFVRKSEGDAG
jgi:hypothetical protein